MKNKKFLALSATFLLATTLSAVSLTSCSNSDATETDKDPAIVEIYNAYVRNAEENGTTPLSYEDWLASIKGEKGDKGDKGDTGATGETGPQGPQGDKGDKGDTGETGPQGPQGDKGDKGDTGETGPKGDKGDKGDTGETGPQGPQGDKGDTGETGPKGDKGDKGDTGETGPKGDKGDKGDAGEAGKDGSSFLTGEGVPGNNVGKDGDSYLDYATWDFYVKSNGAWVKIGNIKGADGSDGKDGESAHIHKDSNHRIEYDEDGVNVNIVADCATCGTHIVKQMARKTIATFEDITSQKVDVHYMTETEPGTWESTNGGIKSSDSYHFIRITKGGVLNIDYKVSSENNSDKLNIEIQEVGTTRWTNKLSKSGDSSENFVEGNFTTTVNEGDIVKITYHKDSSVDKGLDKAIITFKNVDISYNVLTFKGGNGDEEPMFIEDGTVVGELPVIARDDDRQYFDGWTADKEHNIPFSTTGITSDTSAYAKWVDPAMVTFHLHDDIIEKHQTKPGTALEVEAPTWDEHYFLGWYTEATYENAWDSTAVVNSSIDVYAKWIAVSDAHELYGSYKGFSISNTGSFSTNNIELTVTPDGAIDLRTAYWDHTIDKFISKEGNSYATESAALSQVVKLSDDVLVVGNGAIGSNSTTYVLFKDFAGFNRSSDISGKSFTIGDTKNAIIHTSFSINGTPRTFFADFRNPANPYIDVDVSAFNTKGEQLTSVSGSEPTISFRKGEVEKAKLYSTYTGYTDTPTDTLAGHYTTEDGRTLTLTGTGYALFTNFTYNNGSSTGTSNCKSLSSSCVYTVDSVNPNVIYLSYSSSVRKVITIDKEAGTFTKVEWIEHVTFDFGYKANESDESNIKYEMDMLHNTTIWFDDISYDGGTIDSPTREGYIFDGWYDNAALTGKAVSKVNPTASVTLYAKWVTPVTVTAHLNNGLENVVYSVKPGVDVSVDTPTKSGFKFDGWYADEALTTKWDGKSGEGNIDIYAKWIEAFDYSSYVGTYAGNEVYSSGKNKTHTYASNSNYEITETGSLLKGTYDTKNTFVESIEETPNHVLLSNGNKVCMYTANDGRKFMLMYYSGPSSSVYFSSDLIITAKIDTATETTTVTQTYLVNKIWAVKFEVTNNETETTTVYNVLIDGNTASAYFDVSYYDGDKAITFDGIYGESAYSVSTLTVKQGDATICSFTANEAKSSLTRN